MDKLTVNEMIDAIKKNYPPPQYSMLMEALDHASELMKAESEGRLLVLPCKVGDMLYVIIDGKIYEGEVYHISYSDYYGKVTATAWTKGGVGGNLEDFGKTVFLTREAAEAALMEREGK